MRRISTRCMNDIEGKSRGDQVVACEPRKKTLDFLRQFARSYQGEPALQAELGGYMKN